MFFMVVKPVINILISLVLQKTFPFNLFMSLKQSFDNICRLPVLSLSFQKKIYICGNYFLREDTKTGYFPQVFWKVTKEIPLKVNILTTFQFFFPQYLGFLVHVTGHIPPVLLKRQFWRKTYWMLWRNNVFHEVWSQCSNMDLIWQKQQQKTFSRLWKPSSKNCGRAEPKPFGCFNLIFPNSASLDFL